MRVLEEAFDAEALNGGWACVCVKNLMHGNADKTLGGLVFRGDEGMFGRVRFVCVWVVF